MTDRALRVCMFKRRLYRFVFILFSLSVMASPPLAAENAGIRDILVTNDETHVRVYARVTDGFTTDIEAAILAGVPTTFTFYLDLFQQRSGWMDRKLGRTTVRHTIIYDNVKKWFVVSYDGEKETMSFTDFESAQRAMAELNGIPVAELKALKRSENYYVMIKATLDEVRMPFHMERVFFFVSLWDFETDWYRERFYYR